MESPTTPPGGTPPGMPASSAPTHKSVSPVVIEEELKSSFLEYAMSVVVSRALPDVRDGLKPVHRRILVTMNNLGFFYNRPYHKSVRVVGDVMGKYHPHGDQAVYNTMVGMVQNFSKRYPLLDGQGNWGSIDGDNAAAMRYTEVRMQKIAQELLEDLDKNTVPFVPNFDDSTVEPTVLPSKIPHLLINGTAGIAVGMATSIPPHNAGEVIDACLALLNNPNLSDDELFSIVPGPDFPTGGILCGRAGILRAYREGRSSVTVRGVVHVEETKRGTAIVITELPYQVVKSELIIKIADLVKQKTIDGITNIRDESDKKGIRVVIELRRGEVPEVIINQLYKHTSLQSSMSVLLLGLLDNRPLVFTLRELIREFLRHREQIVYKRTQFDCDKARAREHLIAGMLIVLDNIDEVVQLIKQSRAQEDALSALTKRFGLTDVQGKAVLDMRLQRLTGMERERLLAERAELETEIARLQSILADVQLLRNEIAEELAHMRALYADARRTQLGAPVDVLSEIDLIPDEGVVVTLTRKGYIKRVTLTTYGVQHRGGKGKLGIAALDDSDDVVQDIFVARTHDELLFFTNLGRVYSLNVFEVPEASRTARGRAIVNLLPLVEGETVVKLLCVRDLEGKSLMMGTRQGTIKRTAATAFASIRSTGIRALTLNDGDELAFCGLCTDEDSVVLATREGQGIHFKVHEVREMGRQAAGVRGIRLHDGDVVVGMQVVAEDKDILFATARGYGKRVRVSDFRIAHRGGLGVRTIPTNQRNGQVIGLVVVDDISEILLIDTKGKIIRLSPKEVRTMGRQAQGVRLIRLDEDQRLTGIAVFSGETNEPADGAIRVDTELEAGEHDEQNTEHEPVEHEPLQEDAGEEHDA